MATTESVLEQPAAHLHPSSLRTLDQTSLHLLPCGIQHDGKANIPGFFFLVDGTYPSTLDHTSATTTTITTITTAAGVLESTTSIIAPEVSFRGRTLKGTVMKVPAGYMGTIYNVAEQKGHTQDNTSNGAKPNQDMMDLEDEDQEYEAMLKGMQEERKAMKTEAQFQEWTSWGHDDQPTARTDKVVRAMQWIDIANVLHEPLC
ncbi:Ribonuclease H2 subunit C [Mortierella hygrophila]|uniref:Ribonuclease H2 subunit C n=1 Tax=Mortierella hygrophila TaxID=979708 RepID=A0A9P6F1C4_9FUNG|nr:Ribonuclease H2 subunit C [Mortierella hygrophila]